MERRGGCVIQLESQNSFPELEGRGRGVVRYVICYGSVEIRLEDEEDR